MYSITYYDAILDHICFNTFWYIHFALLLFCYLVYLFHPEALLHTRMQRTHRKSPIGSQCPKSLFLVVVPFERHLPVFDQFKWNVLTLLCNVCILICDIIDAIKSLFPTFIWLFIVCVALSTNENWFWSFFSAIDDASEAMESLLSSCYNQMKNHSNIIFSIFRSLYKFNFGSNIQMYYVGITSPSISSSSFLSALSSSSSSSLATIYND